MSRKTAILLHGTDGNDQDYFWFTDTQQYLIDAGYDVWWPQLPHTERPELTESLDFVLDAKPTITEDTIIIGHSAGCPLILGLLPLLDMKIKQAILVSGYYEPLNPGSADQSKLMLQDEYDWAAIKSRATEIIFINSDNDPWGCTDLKARPTVINLDATLITATHQGHMGSDSNQQPYREFPLLKRLLRTESH